MSITCLVVTKITCPDTYHESIIHLYTALSSFVSATIMDSQLPAIVVNYHALAVPLDPEVYQSMTIILTHLFNHILTVLSIQQGDTPVDDLDIFVELFRKHVNFAWLFCIDNSQALSKALISSSFLDAYTPAANIVRLLSLRHTLAVQDGESKLAEAIAQARTGFEVFGLEISLAAAKRIREPLRAVDFAVRKMEELKAKGDGSGVKLSPPGRNLTVEEMSILWAWLDGVVDGEASKEPHAA
jgi:hypothetical protein